MGAAGDPEGGPATFVGAAWLTVGLEFVNHGFQRPGPTRAIPKCPMGFFRPLTNFAIDA